MECDNVHLMTDTEETPLVHAADLMTTTEVARQAGVTQMTVTRWVHRHQLKPLRREPFIFHRQTVEAFLERSNS